MGKFCIDRIVQRLLVACCDIVLLVMFTINPQLILDMLQFLLVDISRCLQSVVSFIICSIQSVGCLTICLTQTFNYFYSNSCGWLSSV